MKRTTMFLDEKVEKDLQVLARERGTPVAALVREALGEYLARARGAPTLSFVAVGGSGQSDTAERHEDLLWREPHPAPRRARTRTRGKKR